MKVRFDEAPVRAAEVLAQLVSQQEIPLGVDAVVLRGVTGHVSLLVLDHDQPLNRTKLEALQLRAGAAMVAAGAYASRTPVITSSSFADPVGLLKGATSSVELTSGEVVKVVERVLVGHDWYETPAQQHSDPVRGAFFGIKGGVGRSTASVALAVHAARAGERVLLIDLDLESPGVGPIALGAQGLPDFGIVDALVEDVVDQLDEDLLSRAFSEARFAGLGHGGALLVAPARGGMADGAAYGSKLSRLYLATGSPPQGLGQRLVRVIEQLEAVAKPTLTLVDSRAGLHDLAAIAITRLGARGFLFGAATAQTFEGYRLLFERWAEFGEEASDFRERLKMVAALLPGPERREAFGDFQQDSWTLFTSTLYEEVPEGTSDLEFFSFGVDDDSGPHYPLATIWNDTLLRFDPLASDEWLDGPPWAALEEFVVPAYRLLVEDRGLGD